ncbi:MAG: AAA family ATPase [Paludibacter sp.]|nr:AAA family ATPase [Paludibacter sp.]
MQELSEFYQFAHEFALSTNRSIFLTGKAGTGKTTFLHNLRHETKKQMAIVAPTGVAAINAGGTTIHSFFQLPFTPFIPTVEGRKELIEKIKMHGSRRKVIQELELLVIDEISMVRADILDAIDTILRHIRYRFTEPFGGVQLIFIGDMFQLSPVAVEGEWRLLAPYYKSPYFFHSQVIEQQKPVYIELDKIFRQSDPEFIRVLNEVRNNCLSNKSLSVLQDRYNPFFVAPRDDTYITLTTHNYKADKINAEELNSIHSSVHKFEAEIKGEFSEKSYPTDKVLELKKGAKVMFIKNDTETPRRFFNGKIGTIQSFDDETIIIECPEDSEPIELSRMVWENIRYTINSVTKQIEEETTGTFNQFPLRLAWAITIHKSQGLTFDKAIIDAGDAFAPGQVYVALSRCRNLSGMILWSKINPQSIENDKIIVEHERTKPQLSELEKQLNESKSEFRQYILNQLFDFRTGTGLASRLLRNVESAESSFNEDTIPFLKNIIQQLQEIQSVADKFENQIQQLLSSYPVNEDYLNERLEAASHYFRDKTNLLIDTLKESPATTDSRDNAREYDGELKNIFGFATQKFHILENLQTPFDVEDYFILKNTFLLPDFRTSSYAKSAQVKTKVSSKNPELYHELTIVRNRICEPDNLPIYLVAGSKTLLQMSEMLPQTEKDLLKIYGFGPAKVEKYGSQFIEVIKHFCEKYHLTTQMLFKEIPEPKQKEKKEKKQKGDSKRLTLTMYNEGKSIEDIAHERNLVPSTICSHLAGYAINGILNMDQFISPEKRTKAEKLLENRENAASVTKILSEILDQNEIVFFMAWKRSQSKA